MSLASLQTRLQRLEKAAGERRALQERRSARTLRGASDQELSQLRALLLTDPVTAAALVQRLEERAFATSSAPSLPAALQAEQARRSGGPVAPGSEWDLLSSSELRRAIALLRGAQETEDGEVELSASAELQIGRFRRRAELRALLQVGTDECVAGRDGCMCMLLALDRLDAVPALRVLGARGALLVARRLHSQARRPRASGALRRARRREREQAEVVQPRPVELPSPRVARDASAVIEPFAVESDDAFYEPEVEPVRPRRTRARLSAGMAGGRESDAEFLEGVFGLPAGSTVNVAAQAPPESALHVLRRGRAR